MEFIRPLPVGQVWIEGRAEADAVDDDGGLARGEIVDEADQLLGVASLRIIKASHPGFRAPVPATQPEPSQAPSPPGPTYPGPAQLGPVQPQAHTPPGPLLGVVSRQADSGQSAWMFRPPPGAANSFGMVHGGVLGLLAHEVASDAQRSLIGPGEELIPLDLVVNFYRGVPASGRLAAATARVTHRGRRFVVAEGEVAGPTAAPRCGCPSALRSVAPGLPVGCLVLPVGCEHLKSAALLAPQEDIYLPPVIICPRSRLLAPRATPA